MATIVKGEQGDIGIIPFERMRSMLIEPFAYGNELILSDRMSLNYELFKYPFRLDGIVMGLVTRGKVVVYTNLNEFEIASGTLFFIMPENIIQLKEKSDDFEASLVIASASYLSRIHIDIHSIIPLYVQVKESPFMMLTQKEYDSFLQYFSLLEEALESTYFRDEMVRGLTSAYAYTIANILQREIKETRENAPRDKTRKDVIFERFIWLLLQHYERERKVEFYANQLHVTPKHLATVVKNVSGKTAAEWIDEYVILEAKARIKYSSFSIQEVAFSLNFPSATFFCKYFKNQTGITPSEYRKQ